MLRRFAEATLMSYRSRAIGGGVLALLLLGALWLGEQCPSKRGTLLLDPSPETVYAAALGAIQESGEEHADCLSEEGGIVVLREQEHTSDIDRRSGAPRRATLHMLCDGEEANELVVSASKRRGDEVWTVEALRRTPLGGR